MTREEIELRVLAEHRRLVGTEILVAEVTGFVDEDQVEFFLDPPARMRVEAGFDAVVRWMDDEWCDPIWDVKLIEPHPQLAHARSFWMYGTSYSTHGSTEPARMTLATSE